VPRALHEGRIVGLGEAEPPVEAVGVGGVQQPAAAGERETTRARPTWRPNW
jgi:hypothetical protein